MLRFHCSGNTPAASFWPRSSVRCGLILVMQSALLAHTAFAEDVDKCNVLDPEFQDDLDILTFQRVVPGGPQRAMLQYVDPNDDGTPLAGTEDELSSGDIASYTVSQAGPKWANGEDSGHNKERFIVYTKASANEQQVRLYKHNPTAPNCAPGNQFPADCFLGITNTIPMDPPDPGVSRYTVYSTEEEALTYPAQVVYHYGDDSGPVDQLRFATLDSWLPGLSEPTEPQFSDAPANAWARLAEFKTSGGGGMLRAVTTFAPAGTPNLQQVHLLNPADPDTNPVNVTNSMGGGKFNPFLFYNTNTVDNANDSPNTNMVVFRYNPPGNPNRTDLKVFANLPKGSTTWVPFMSVGWEDLLPDEEERPFLLSPEAFTNTNASGEKRTWLVFSSADERQAADQSDGNIWVALVRSGAVAAVQVNTRPTGAEAAVRSEGEVYFPNDGHAVMFYSQLATTDNSLGCQVYPSGAYRLLSNYVLRRVANFGQLLESVP